MSHRLSQLALTVHDYDEAITFFVRVLGFTLVEDTDMGNSKRWVRVRPAGQEDGPDILLARAVDERQRASVGHQTGGRVFLFLETDDFQRDYEAWRAKGVEFVRGPSVEAYGTVGVFKDLYGNLWDLIERRTS